jgi:hypothetical protein
MYTGLRAQYPLLFWDFNDAWMFPDRFSESIQISNFMKIHPVGAELFRADE